MAATQDSRILIKRSTVTTEVPTVAPSTNHLDGSWDALDIYKGELFLNTEDGRAWFRGENGIIELQTVAALPANFTLTTRTIFVDYVNGDDSTGVIGDINKPYQTKAEALTAAITLTPTATNRVRISVAMGDSTEAITYTSAVVGVDWDLNGGALRSSASTYLISDGGFACDTVIYNVGTLLPTTTRRILNVTASSTIVIHVDKISSAQVPQIVCTAGTITINVRSCVCISNTNSIELSNAASLTINGDFDSTSAGDITLANTSSLKVNGNLKCTAVTITGTASLTVNGNANISTLSNSGGTAYITGNLNSTAASAIDHNSGTTTVKGYVLCTGVSSSGLDVVDCSGGTLIVEGDITGSDTHATTAYAAIVTGGVAIFNGNIASVNSPSLRITGGTCRVGSGSRIGLVGAANAISKDGGTLILNSPVLLAATNSVASTGAENILLYGTGVQSVVEDANTTFQVGTMITDANVV